MKNKITVRKTKLVAKGISKKTKLFVKKASKKAGEMTKEFKKEWKKEQPEREKLKKNAKKMLEHGIKIGNDVFETIRKDVSEINRQKKSKK